jgi:PAS domain S-box-containing protein
LSPSATARRSRTALVAGLLALAGGAAIMWTHWLSPSLEVGVMPLAGVALAALLVLEPRQWPLPLCTLAVTVTGVGLLYDSDVARALAPAAAAIGGAVVTALLLRMFANGPFTLRRVVDVLSLAVMGVFGAVVGAAIGTAVMGLTPDDHEYWAATGRGGVASWLGIVVMTTLILSWSTPTVALRRPRAREAVVLGLAVVGLGILALRVSSDPRSYVVVLVLVWAAIRFRLRGVATAALALVAIGDWAVARHTGPLVHVGQSAEATILAFQAFAGTALLSLLLLAAALDERDVTEARRYVVNDRFRRTFDAAPVGIALTTLDGVITEANPALCGILGYSRRELVGQELESLRSRDEPSGEWSTAQLAAIDAGDPVAVERRYVSAKGAPVRAEVREFQIRGDGGRPESGIAIVNDVTHRKDLEEQVLHAQKMDTVGRLAGSIAHDFNNLLAVMQSHSELLEDDLTVLERARHRLDAMRRATDRAAALTDDLLTFSRRSTDEPETIDVHEVITAAHDMLTQLVAASVTIELQLDATSTRVDADPRRIEQVLVNLVVNASDAMPSGGRITLATSDRYGSEGTDKELRSLAIVVSDTGTGMAPHVQHRIFEPFFTTKPPGSGTGLGLATADAVVRSYGGTITVESRMGEGTTFVITLPLSAQTEPAADAPWPDAPWPDLASRPSDTALHTILVVDDEPDARAGVAEILRRRGYRVLEAHDAADAIDVASNVLTPINLLVSDVVMPGVGGPELADQIRIQFPDVEVLFVSGYSDIDATSPCLHGATLLRKPVQGTALIASVEHALTSHDTRITARSGIPRPSP